MKMDRNQLFSRLRKTFERNQNEIQNLNNLESGNGFISDLIENSLEDCSKRIKNNIERIVQYYLFTENGNVQDLIDALQDKENSSFDAITVEREKEDDFDNTYGTLTGVIMEQFMMEDLISLDRFQSSARYHPTPVKSMYLALDTLPKYDIKYSDSVFIDIGSGMGRNLLIASEYAFKEIIGVEISQHLSEIADKNIEVYKTETQKCKNIKSYCGDVLEFVLPEYKSLVLYFWEPFNDHVFSLFFQKLLQSISLENKKVTMIFLGKVYPELKESKFFELKEVRKTNDRGSEKDNFSISIYTN